VTANPLTPTPPSPPARAGAPDLAQPKATRAGRRGSHRRRRDTRGRRYLSILACIALILGAGAAVAADRLYAPAKKAPTALKGPFIGLYNRAAPISYEGVNQFAQAAGTQPNLVSYYSPWLEPFQSSFAAAAAKHGAVPLVQINPFNVSLAAIASGQYDAYLRTFADEVRSYRHPVILSFGHEMNGKWYSWGYTHTPPATFVAAWRHIVQQFRKRGASNVTWMWTINIMDLDPQGGIIPRPTPWWPGRSYVNWVGLDGYYQKSTWTFASMFGPTIKVVRTLTRDPILIAETGVAPAAGKPAKIANLFAGVRAYGLRGFIWFDAPTYQDWRINSPAAFAAFRQGAKALKRPAS
jgi:mannan endo-1,4-beta-mannosidase